MEDIWKQCGEDAAPITTLNGSLLRLVESQEQIATGRIVSSLERQALLEEMLEAAKPPAAHSKLHYLLSTPFRYAPLRYGSRFGSRNQTGLFYGSLTLSPLLAESAYYRFVFWHGMADPPRQRYLTQHTLFAARYRTRRGIRLQCKPFDRYRIELRDPTSYTATQLLGKRMRAAGVEAFEYASARDPEAGINVALFTPAALASTRPLNTQQWLCETSATSVRFHGRQSTGVRTYPLAMFLVGGVLPQPAA